MIQNIKKFKRIANLLSLLAITMILCISYFAYTLPYQHTKLHDKTAAAVSPHQAATSQTATILDYQPLFTLNLRQDIYDKPKIVKKAKPKAVKPLPVFTLLGMYGGKAVIMYNKEMIYPKVNEKFGPENNPVTIVKINSNEKTITVSHSSGNNITIKVKKG